MYRTNIYLNDDERRALRARARAEGTSVASVVRAILDRELGLTTRTDDARDALDQTFGIWSDMSEEELAEIRAARGSDRFDRFQQ